MNPDKIRNIIEAILFSSETPVTMEQLAQSLDEIDREQLGVIMDALVTEWRSMNRGFALVEVAGGWQFRTRAEFGAWLQRAKQDRPSKLSRASLETLSIIAYKQPITRPEIEDLRGVDSGAVVKNLLDRNLIKIIGKKDAPGKPVVYGTTQRFLEVFSLRDLGSLPSLRDLRELEDDGGQQLALPTGGDEEGIPQPPEGEAGEPVVKTDSDRRREIRESVRQMLASAAIVPDEPLTAEEGLPPPLPDDDGALHELEEALNRRKEVAERTEALLDDSEKEYIEKVTGGGDGEVDEEEAEEEAAEAVQEADAGGAGSDDGGGAGDVDAGGDADQATPVSEEAGVVTDDQAASEPASSELPHHDQESPAYDSYADREEEGEPDEFVDEDSGESEGPDDDETDPA